VGALLPCYLLYMDESEEIIFYNNFCVLINLQREYWDSKNWSGVTLDHAHNLLKAALKNREKNLSSIIRMIACLVHMFQLDGKHYLFLIRRLLKEYGISQEAIDVICRMSSS